MSNAVEVTVLFAETFDIFGYSTQLIPEIRSCTLNPSQEDQGQEFNQNKSGSSWLPDDTA
jgi:hypothetical protein